MTLRPNYNLGSGISKHNCGILFGTDYPAIHKFCGRKKADVDLKTDKIDFLVRTTTPIEGVCGVYAIWFGGKVYVGQAKNLADRLMRHSSMINGYLNGKYADAYYHNIIQHIIDNTIVSAYIDVLCICEPSELPKMENKFIKQYRKQGVCFNTMFLKEFFPKR